MNDWHHAPKHLVSEKGTYMITGATYLKKHLFKDPENLDFVQNALMQLSEKYLWNLQAWAIFSNHYHFIGESAEDPSNLPTFIGEFHYQTAKHINDVDKQINRKVWHQYWDTHLSFQKSYLSRLHYVINNPIKHGLVKIATHYPWCSASWFEKNASDGFKKLVSSFKIDKVNVIDDF